MEQSLGMSDQWPKRIKGVEHKGLKVSFRIANWKLESFCESENL
jgi:hypothetical protein